MTTQDDVCARASKDLARRLKAPALVATTIDEGDVRHIFWSADDASVGDLEGVAEALLTTALQVRLENGEACPNCAKRAEVLRAALALIAPHAAAAVEGPDATQPRHLH